MPQPVNALANLPMATVDAPGAINGIAPGAMGAVRPGHPYFYQIKGRKLVDPAGVEIPSEELEGTIMRAQQKIINNIRSSPGPIANFANADLLYGVAAMNKVLDEYRKMNGK